MNKTYLKKLLDKEVASRNKSNELTQNKPDPLLVAKRYNDEYICLICALFAYGNAKLIVKFLNNLDFSLLDASEETIKKEIQSLYRFQTSCDIANFFISCRRLKLQDTLENIFKEKYNKTNSILEGIDNIIKNILSINHYNSDGYRFLVGTRPKRDKNNQIKLIGNAPYKRYNMLMRWLVRKDNIDLGLWKDIKTSNLIIPLDTHTFKIAQKLNLLQRKRYDLKSAVLLTLKLKEFDLNDPVKYDFALYRIGQEKKAIF